MKNDKAVAQGVILNDTLELIKQQFTKNHKGVLEDMTHDEFDQLRVKLRNTFHAWVIYSNLHLTYGFEPSDLEAEVVIDVRRNQVRYIVSDRMQRYIDGDIPPTEMTPSFTPGMISWRTQPYKRVNFALDFDETASEDLEMWVYLSRMMRSRGHKVYIVTMRYPSECGSIPKVLIDSTDGLYPTSRQAKNAYMLSKNIVIHNWIDDSPRAVYMNAEKAFGVSTSEGDVPNAHILPAVSG